MILLCVNSSLAWHYLRQRRHTPRLCVASILSTSECRTCLKPQIVGDVPPHQKSLSFCHDTRRYVVPQQAMACVPLGSRRSFVCSTGRDHLFSRRSSLHTDFPVIRCRIIRVQQDLNLDVLSSATGLSLRSAPPVPLLVIRVRAPRRGLHSPAPPGTRP